MTARWVRTAAVAGLPGMPRSARAIRQFGAKKGWVSRRAPGDKRNTIEWLVDSLPSKTRACLTTPARAGAGSHSQWVLVPSGTEYEASSIPDTPRGALADARAEIVRAFEDWWPSSLALVPALKEFSTLYAAGKIPVSDETRVVKPAAAWNSIQRWRARFLRGGTAGLLAGVGGRTSIIDSDRDFATDAAALLIANPHHVTARQIGEVLAARYPDRAQPGIASIRRWVRRWRAENARAVSAVADPDMAPPRG